MPAIKILQERFLNKLYEMFRLDEPDLDFGFYRIMHAKRMEVSTFLENDLLATVSQSIAEFDKSDRSELQFALENAIEQAQNYGAPKPEDTKAAKEIKAKLEALENTHNAEAEIYDHLYRFFERYFDDGDFLTRRYYARETSERASPFVIPYSGEEVKLHYANSDQYYIKSAEHFSNVTFDLRQAKELREEGVRLMGTEIETLDPLRIHFRVVYGTEGEHGDVKPSAEQKRYFLLSRKTPIEFTSDNELLVNFEYRPDADKKGQDQLWRKLRNVEAVDEIFSRLHQLVADKDQHSPQVEEYLRLLSTSIPTNSDPTRTLLSKCLNRFTERNTKDYFIHKNLGGFLRRELNFYLKNEVLAFEGLSELDTQNLERSLLKIKLIKTIAIKLIDFLAQLENFQKRLWLKKKFVLETNYCVTLDRVPQELYEEISRNERQREEWVRECAIDEIHGDLDSPGFSVPLTPEFLQCNDRLVLDTRWFSTSFKEKLLATLSNLHDTVDGVLIHAENFQVKLPQFDRQFVLGFAVEPFSTAYLRS